MKYVLLDCDYTEREDYRLNKDISEDEIRAKEATEKFVESIVEYLKRIEGYEYVTEVILEPFVEKNSALELLHEDGDKEKVKVLDDMVYATCLVEGDSEVVNRGLDAIAESVVSLSSLYSKLEEAGLSLPVVSTSDLRDDIVSDSLLKRENLLTKGKRK
ncbi:MAG: hypothetical protein II119_01815 [Bacilli bacterium]|nr:hypothetical protein [Bacilli bacterium]MBQ6282466.1 hypothetical protein [Bacilli bacterium]